MVRPAQVVQRRLGVAFPAQDHEVVGIARRRSITHPALPLAGILGTQQRMVELAKASL
jgi:hypothetical protein